MQDYLTHIGAVPLCVANRESNDAGCLQEIEKIYISERECAVVRQEALIARHN